MAQSQKRAESGLGGRNQYRRKARCECASQATIEDEDGDLRCLMCGLPKVVREPLKRKR